MADSPPSGSVPSQRKRRPEDQIQTDSRPGQRQKIYEQTSQRAVPVQAFTADLNDEHTAASGFDINDHVEQIDQDANWVEPTLDKEQAAIVDAVCEGGRNVFYTGSAGVGKSLVLKVVVKRLAEMNKRVFKIAPTGIAALSISGSTLHSYSGMYPSDKTLSIGVAMKSRRVKLAKATRMSQTDVLVIDEISMVSHFLLQRLEFLLKISVPRDPHYHGQIPPFGGIQLVVTGDFCQLPPVKPFEHCWYCGCRFVESHKRYSCSGEKTPEHPAWNYTDDDRWAFRAP